MKELFYVTVRDAGRVGWLLGPYDDPEEAKAQVDRGRALAEAKDAWAHFYAIGTTGVTGGAPRATRFGR